jgi:6-phosphogluconolactonase
MSKSIHLVVGTYTEKMPHVPTMKSNGQGVHVFDLSSKNLTETEKIPNIINPSYVAITKNKRFLYANTESLTEEKSLVHGFEILRDSSSNNGVVVQFRYIDSWPIGGIGACHVNIDTQDRFVYVSNYNGGNASSFRIQNDGKLVKANFHQFTEHTNVDKERQEAPHCHSSALDKNSRFVYFVDLGNDCIWRSDFSAEKGFDEATFKKFSSPPGSGPRSLVFDPREGKYLYVSCELTNYLLVYKMDDKGDLTQIQYEPITPRILKEKVPSGAADIRISEDARFVYVSTRFINIISVFEINPNDGKAKFVQEIGCGGEIPRAFVIYEPFHQLLVGNQDSNDIVVFERDAQTGRLKESYKTKAHTPTCLEILD